MGKQLEELWDSIGRGGAKKLRDAARKAGLQTSLKDAENFVKRQAESQVFANAPQTSGKIVAPRCGTWLQLDLVDYKASPAGGKTVALVATDVLGRSLAFQSCRRCSRCLCPNFGGDGWVSHHRGPLGVLQRGVP